MEIDPEDVPDNPVTPNTAADSAEANTAADNTVQDAKTETETTAAVADSVSSVSKAVRQGFKDSLTNLGLDDTTNAKVQEAFDDLDSELIKQINTAKGDITTAWDNVNIYSLAKDTDIKGNGEALKKALNKIGSSMYKSLSSANSEAMSKFISDLNKDMGKQTGEISDTDLSKLNKRIGELTSENSELREQIEKSQTAQDGKVAEKGQTPGNRISVDQIIKIMSMLLMVGGTVAAYFVIKNYCQEHSGCILYHDDGVNPMTNNKQYCVGTMGWSPQACICDDTTPSDTGRPKLSSDYCSGQSKDGKKTPEDFDGGTLCNNWQTKLAPYDYYSYVIMSPIDGLLNVVYKVGDMGIKDFGQIVEILKKAGFVVLAIFVLFIVFRIITAIIPKKKTE